MKLRFLMLGAVLWLGALTPHLAQACRFNIRDVGFTDLQATPYRLFLYVDDSVTTDMVKVLERSAHAALVESNVRPETINLSTTPDHSAVAWRPSGGALPVAALVHRSGRSLAIALSQALQTDDDLDKALWPVLHDIVASPLRQKFLDKVAETYATVLLIESNDEETNRVPREAALAAIEALRSQLPFMAKPVDAPPRLLNLPVEQHQEERVVLWSMGFDQASDETPAVIVLFGRGRRIGPTLTGEDLTQDNITRILSVIGADCECGLDRVWMEGDTMPLPWTVDTRNRVARSLGFDPESPLIKTEMSQILLQGIPSGRSMESVFRDTPVTFFGYSEQVITFEPQEPADRALTPAELRAQMVGADDRGLERATVETQDAFSTPTVVAPLPTVPERPLQAAAPHDSAVDPPPGALAPSMRWAMLIVGLLLLAVVATGVIILLKARGRTR